MNLHVNWIRNCKTEEEKQKKIQTVLASSYVLGLLKELVLLEKNLSTRNEETIEDFDTPNWAEKQAFRNGLRAGLRKVEDLLGHI